MSKKWFVVDAHNHYYPEEATKKVAFADGMDYTAGFKGVQANAYSRAMSIDLTVKLMDDAGVDMAVLEQAALSPVGIELCKAMNDGYAQAASAHPGRFIPCVHLPLDSSATTLNELDRAINTLGLKGVTLVTSTSTVTLDSETLFPLYQKISQMDVPIMVHPSIRVPIWGGVKHKMSSTVSREYDVTKATVEVLFGVLPKFPNLKFVMPHHGGGTPSLKGRVMAWFEPEGWEIPQEIKAQPKTPRELKQLGIDKVFDEMFDKIYFDTAGFGGWMPITESATRVIRTDRLCFGTDYPFEIHEAQDIKIFIDNIKKLKLTESDKRNILGENIRRLFKL
jgi:predicted TIM-barrel fold metal-dependent hydrolase